MSDLDTLAAYHAARGRVAWADFSDYGWLEATGPDRLDFLHRLSTNDFRNLAPGAGLPTVLTNPTGRVLALLIALATSDALYLRAGPGQAPALARYLNSMIFWQDNVRVTDASGDVAQFALFGPAAGETLARLSGGAVAEAPYAWRAATIGGVAVKAQRGGPLDLPAFVVVARRGDAAAVWTALAGVAPVLDRAQVDALRVEAGLPAWGRELSDQVTPLETGLEAAISYTKGCYIGQEVIARQTHYDKITRRLAGLLLPESVEVEPGTAVRAGGGRPGFVGSVAYSPTLDRRIALAVLPRDAAAPGAEVVIGGTTGEITATVAALPFVAAGAHQEGETHA